MSTEATQEQTTPEVENPVVPEQETQVEQPETEAAAPVSDDAAFEAGFNGVDPAPEPEPEPEPPKLIAGMTEDQVKELLAKAAEVDKLREQQAKVFGSLGNLKQSLDALRSQPKPNPAQVQITKEKLARLSQAFPEMAEMIAEDLNGVLTGGAASADPAQFEQVVESKLTERLQQQEQQFEAKVLTLMHPDWKKIVPSEEFGQWKQSLPTEVAQELDSSWSAEFIGEKLTQFKDWKSKLATSQQQKRNRLEQAMTPKSAASPPVLTDDDAFIRGFKEARGIK